VKDDSLPVKVKVSRLKLNFDGVDEKLRQIRQLPEGDKIVDLWQKLAGMEGRIVLADANRESIAALIIERQ
jgi:hypothetical protein